jgi:hypothetical protein
MGSARAGASGVGVGARGRVENRDADAGPDAEAQGDPKRAPPLPLARYSAHGERRPAEINASKQRFVARPTDGWLKALIAGAGAGSGLLAKRSESA